MPITGEKKSKRIDVVGLSTFFLNLDQPFSDMLVILEKVGTMPKQGIVSAFNFGKGVGYLECMFKLLRMPYVEVRPQEWKKEVLKGMDWKGIKRISVEFCLQRYPEVPLLRTDRCKVPCDGLSDALCLAEYGRLRYGGGCMKICTGCGEKKDESEFYKRGGRPISRCKKCSIKSIKKWKDWSPEKKEACIKRNREWVRNNKEKRKAYREKYKIRSEYARIKSRYGLSKHEYDTMIITQRSVCAICARHNGEKSLDIDHCHESGLVRGLLCRNCNFMLGHAGDLPENLINGAKYLADRKYAKGGDNEDKDT